MATTYVDLDPVNSFSVIRANRILRERSRKFEENVTKFLERLAEIGKEAAQGAYGGAIKVTVEPIENGMSIIANGKAVVFLEFGAGATVNTGNRYASQMGFPVERGSYSDQSIGPDGRPPGEYTRSGYRQWHIGNTVVTEVQPRNGMEHAYQAIIESIHSVAREVFGS